MKNSRAFVTWMSASPGLNLSTATFRLFLRAFAMQSSRPRFRTCLSWAEALAAAASPNRTARAKTVIVARFVFTFLLWRGIVRDK